MNSYNGSRCTGSVTYSIHPFPFVSSLAQKGSKFLLLTASFKGENKAKQIKLPTNNTVSIFSIALARGF